jgi:nucleotide-binding universal stress UspA family protein
MRILVAVDGSKFTKKALAFLVNQSSLSAQPNTLHILNVEMPIPPRARAAVGRAIVDDYHQKEADKVLQPIRKFLDRHPVSYTADWVVGHPADEIVKAAKADKSHLIVMGTHGHGVIGRVLMGSVAQRVVSHCDVPVLLVR